MKKIEGVRETNKLKDGSRNEEAKRRKEEEEETGAKLRREGE